MGVIPGDLAIAVLVIQRQGTQAIELSAEFLHAAFQACIRLAQPGTFLLDRLRLSSLSLSALCCCELVLFAEALLLSFGDGVGATVLLAIAASFLDFAVPLVGGMAGSER